MNVSGLKGTAAQLIAHLGMTPEPAATKLAEYLLTNRLPITKETFQSALQWLKAAEAAEAGLSACNKIDVHSATAICKRCI